MTILREVKAKALGLAFITVLPLIRFGLNDIWSFPSLGWQFMMLILAMIIIVWLLIAISKTEDERADAPINAALVIWGLLFMFFTNYS